MISYPVTVASAPVPKVSASGAIDPNVALIEQETKKISDAVTTNGMLTITGEALALLEGKSYVAGYIARNVSNNGTTRILLKSGAKSLGFSYTISANGTMEYGVYKNPTVTANGAPIVVDGSKNMVTVVPKTLNLFSSPTATLGSLFVPRIIFSPSTSAKGGVSTQYSQTLIMPPNSNIIIEASNKSSASMDIAFEVNWIEFD